MRLAARSTMLYGQIFMIHYFIQYTQEHLEQRAEHQAAEGHFFRAAELEVSQHLPALIHLNGHYCIS